MPPIEVIYENGIFRALRPIDLAEGTRLEMTMIKIIASEREVAPSNLDRFWSSFGAWQDSRPVEAILGDIHQARRSKSEPPAL